MDEFKLFLQNAKAGLGNLGVFENIDIVIGNESCDLDSTISSLLLGFLLYAQLKTIKDNVTLVLPIMNVREEDFLLRVENCYVLRQCSVDIKQLVYRNQVDLEALLKTKKIRTHLVDHHILSSRDVILKESVVEIFDHRPYDLSCPWQIKQIGVNISEVGSCATLIAHEILSKNEEMLTRPLAFLLYQTIVYDTVGLLPENGRAKEMDIEIATKLEEKFCFEATRKSLFDELWTAHNDVSHLTPKQLLSKDLKIIDGIPVPGLPMLVEDYLKLENASSTLQEFAAEHHSHVMILIGLDAKNEVRRDIGVYFETSDNSDLTLKDIFIKDLINSDNSSEVNFNFIEKDSVVDNVKCFKQGNIKLSRKQIIPVLRNSLVKYNSVCK